MPTRSSATSAARPERISSAVKAERQRRDRRVAAPSPPGFSMPDSIANLPRKPESGGRPASSSAQPAKQRPSTVIVPGTASSAAGSSASSSSSPKP